MIDLLLKYYGIDWLAFICLAVSIYYIGEKKRWAFLLDIFACILYTIVSFMAMTPVFIVTNIVMGVLAFNAWKKWKPEN